ncbi:hypothetical protein O4J56_11285 [Nocardiopsis sp. RSe5-2]|uniref:Uncharacterized protein n=1 Tax=Nocardiopsis endophytica TaxID=3018445 RepID=A0ABT4U2N7_9ACTN|nr:hypothetical protein [Nocardiopsis endophytica]MDA2811217.1 hypothetical protein [Nocardiopsis endophytica]
MPDAHPDEIDRTMDELRRLRRSLLAARHAAESVSRSGGDAVVCRIIGTGADSGR